MTRKDLLDAQIPPIDLPEDKKRELSAALADLLWNAAVVNSPSIVPPKGDEV